MLYPLSYEGGASERTSAAPEPGWVQVGLRWRVRRR